MAKPTEESLIDELVDDAFAPFEALLPRDVLDAFRVELGDALATHPDGAMLVRRALPDPAVHGSGDVARGGGEGDAALDASKTGTGKC